MCRVQNCPEIVYAKKLCKRHYEQVRTKGVVSNLPKGVHREQEFIFKNDICYIPLLNRKGEVIQVAQIDIEDYPLVKDYRFSVFGGKYTGCYIAGEPITLHNLILGRKWVDHKDFNGFNNRRSNLRGCTCQQNQFNKRSVKNSSSKYKGVYLVQRKNGQKYAAQIRINGKNTYLGVFTSEKQAAKCYNRVAKDYHKEFANSVNL